MTPNEQDLFEEVGAVLKTAVHYDRSGRPEGTGEVTFAKRIHATQAVAKLNGAQLDGRAIRLNILETGDSQGNIKQKKSITITKGRGGIVISTNRSRAVQPGRRLRIR